MFMINSPSKNNLMCSDDGRAVGKETLTFKQKIYDSQKQKKRENTCGAADVSYHFQ